MSIEIKDYETKRSVYLSDDIDSVTVTDLKADIQEIIDKDYEIFGQNIQAMSKLGKGYAEIYAKENRFPTINLYINCAGGSIYDGLGLYDFIKYINDNSEHHIRIICQGMVASMATIICLASEDRVATKNTSFLIHSLADIAYGKLQDIEDNLAECHRLNDMTNSIYLEHTNLSKEKLQEVDKYKKDWWFGADKALELGLIKDII